MRDRRWAILAIPEAVGRNELGGYKNKARTVARRKGCLSLSLSLPLSQTIPVASSYSHVTLSGVNKDAG